MRRGRPQQGGRREKPKLPDLLGEPSPSLARIQRMDLANLQEKIDQLRQEQELLRKRLENLRTAGESNPRIERNEKQLERLVALQQAAEQRVTQLS